MQCIHPARAALEDRWRRAIHVASTLAILIPLASCLAGCHLIGHADIAPCSPIRSIVVLGAEPVASTSERVDLGSPRVMHSDESTFSEDDLEKALNEHGYGIARSRETRSLYVEAVLDGVTAGHTNLRLAGAVTGVESVEQAAIASLDSPDSMPAASAIERGHQ